MFKFKKLMIVLVVVSFALAIFSVMPLGNAKVAATTITPLHQLVPIDPATFTQGECETDALIPTIGGADDVFWHFVDSAGNSFTAEVYFTNQVAPFDVLHATLSPYKVVGASHYGVYTPAGYFLTSAWLNGVSTGNFNLSHTCVGTIETTTTVEETTVTETTTTVEETTSTVEETTVTETTVEITTGSIPLSSTSTVEESSITMTTDDIPKTGETGNGNALVIGLILLALAGGLTYIVYRSRTAKQQ
jgi:LPXTG-motif cell wall-anchored protein